ncbi:MAG: baseplate hub domain-containing protein [Brevundimonas aurantiaca]|uniref:baseplate hub domain-containing protein n=1 Tax=Brevundimonas aurantiaca TaxID=74316 RepID=UPI0040344611
MRHIPDDLAARIESGAARLCHVWLVRRVDGTRAGFTDHDRDLTLDGVVCRAASGWTVGAAESGVGLAAGTASASGVLDDASIREADVAQGRLDGAAVELWRVDWSEPGLRVRLWSGTITRLRRQDGAFVADLEGPLAKLERVVGRTYGRLCDARLGDERCGVADAAGRTCDKRWETCVGTFGNGVNFRGFPDVPGDDFLTAWPAQGGRHDGGSRR